MAKDLINEVVDLIVNKLSELEENASETERKIAIKIALNKSGATKRIGGSKKVDKTYTIYNQKAQPKKINDKSLMAVLNHNIKLLSDGEKMLSIAEARKTLNSGNKVYLDSPSSTTKRYILKNKKEGK